VLGRDDGPDGSADEGERREFGRFAAKDRKQRGLGKPETFNFLGFTFICGTSRRGYFQLKRKTRRDRLRVKLKMVKEAMRRRMHQPIPQQGKWLRQVVLGYFNYHAGATRAHRARPGGVVSLP
jgi:RNA-directed DNA polymerase